MHDRSACYSAIDNEDGGMKEYTWRFIPSTVLSLKELRLYYGSELNASEPSLKISFQYPHYYFFLPSNIQNKAISKYGFCFQTRLE